MSETTVVTIPDVTPLASDVDRATRWATSLVVNDPDSEALAAGYVRQINEYLKQVGQLLDEPKAKSHEAHVAITTLYGNLANPLKSAKTIIRRKLATYGEDQRQRQLAAEREAREKSQREAEEATLAEAEKLEAAGKPHEAAQALDRPIVTAPAVVPVQPRTEGVSLRKRWTWRLLDIRLVPPEYLLTDRVKINSVVTAMKGDTRIPGIEAYCEVDATVK